MNRRTSGAVTILAVSLAGAAHAQSVGASFPANLILPNYERVPVGQEESLEAGAWIARTDDALANWYNPAGLARSPGTGLNASANSYRGTETSIEGLENDARSTRVQSVGSFFGGVIAKPLTDADRWRFGFSITTPVAWQPGLIDAALREPETTGDELTLTSDVSLTTLIPGIAASLAASENVRVGAGISVAVTTLDQRQSIRFRAEDADSSVMVAREIAGGGMTTSAFASAGVQWDIGERVRVGAFAATPGVRVTGTSRLSYEISRFTGTSYTDARFRDPESRFEYAIPARGGVGVAWVGERGAIEVDVRVYGAGSGYDLYRTEEIGRTTMTDAAGVPTTTTFTLEPVRNEWDAVTNFAIGGNWKLSRSVRFHAGFGTDQSPVGDASRSLFWDLDLVNVTTGVSVEGSRFSGSVGLAYSGGSSDPFAITDPETNQEVETKLDVKSVSLAYAISIKL